MLVALQVAYRLSILQATVVNRDRQHDTCVAMLFEDNRIPRNSAFQLSEHL